MGDIPSLSNYKDLFNKAEFDFDRLKKTNEIFDLVNCLLTLNALPEWIKKSENLSNELRKIAEEKLKIMTGDQNRFQLDESMLGENIDHQMRFIRLFCNHVKHGEKKQTPLIFKEFGGTYPAEYPVEFTLIIKIGNNKFNAKNLIYKVILYWDDQINKY